MSNIELYDAQGRYYYGKLNENGKILYDPNNNYWYDTVKDDERLEMYDHNNNYLYGRLKDGGRKD